MIKVSANTRTRWCGSELQALREDGTWECIDLPSFRIPSFHEEVATEEPRPRTVEFSWVEGIDVTLEHTPPDYVGGET